MNKINYRNLTDKKIEEIKKAGKRPALLLHACCGPCASYVTEYLKDYFDITLYYYNPNIQPQEEYIRRAENLIKIADYFSVKYIIEDYRDLPFLQSVKGLEKEPEGGRRCKVCTYLRLEETAKKAKEMNFDLFSTTLTISPLKDAESLNKQGGELSEKYGVEFLFSDFKKRGGYTRSIELCKQLGIYRQNYCGCIFGKNLQK